MRIAQVSPLFESVPPQTYGGTERVVSFLTEELVRQGHEVTLFASGDSLTSAYLVSPIDEALRLGDPTIDQTVPQVLQLDQVARAAHEFDVIHWHVDTMHLPLTRRIPTANVTTFHGRLDDLDRAALLQTFGDHPVVSISDAQRQPVPGLGWVATVYHGLPADLYRPQAGDGGYLAFLGRISPEKGPDRAIEIARRAGMPLRIAAKIDDADRDYFETTIRPLLDDANAEFIGEINDREKEEFLGGAAALLFPINWPEPFGLVIVEAMACGTPVVSFRWGSTPEIIRPGVSGFLVDDIDGAVAAVAHLGDLPRAAVRAEFDRRFTAERMAHDYVSVYEEIIRGREMPGGRAAAGETMADLDLDAERGKEPSEPSVVG
ncbi:MAG: glycosyltransferase family 4 protein [Chloroflexota bacterium]|nr:glycosyltransferase family 4 protein [Chloroflexota bacterium]